MSPLTDPTPSGLTGYRTTIPLWGVRQRGEHRPGPWVTMDGVLSADVRTARPFGTYSRGEQYIRLHFPDDADHWVVAPLLPDPEDTDR